jgi:serine/threonine protein kinase
MFGLALNNRDRIEVDLGRGGMGAVNHVHDTPLNRDVAAKVVSDRGLDTERRSRLMNEALADLVKAVEWACENASESNAWF